MSSAVLRKFALDTRSELLRKIETKALRIGTTEQAVIEDAAYCWFIRFITIRYLELNGFINEKPFENTYETENAFRTTILNACNHLQSSFPYFFSKNSSLEALFPDEMLSNRSFISRLTDTSVISNEQWEKVEIIGWLHQYYFSDDKERVIKAKKKYKSAEIPYATQFFTPNWMVRYMVQNTLGRYWVEAHPEHADLIEKWEFYINQSESNHTSTNCSQKLDLKPEELTCFDPAMGSGHILVYMFDVLSDIYLRCGYPKREIPKYIIENNLYGVDIDERVVQIAMFSLMMKAFQYNHDLITIPKFNLAAIQESNAITIEDISYWADASTEENFTKMKAFIDQFIDAKTYGSLLHMVSIDTLFIKEKYNELIEKAVATKAEIQSKQKLLTFLPQFLKQSEILNQQYDVLVTNPPYIGNRYLNNKLADYVEKYYPLGKKDLFSAFMLYSFQRIKEDGQGGFMTPYVWMFLSSYEQLRSYIIDEKSITSLVQLEYSGFEGATVPVCTFTFRNYKTDFAGEYISLVNFRGVKNQPIKTLEAIHNPNVVFRYRVHADLFKKIPGIPFSFWAGPQAIRAFELANQLETIAKPRVGLQTSDNHRFLRLWHEVDIQKIGFGMKNRQDALASGLKWFPYNKGGEFRKWYGNQFYVVNWENDGKEIREYNAYLNASRASKIGIANTDFYFKESISWSFVSSSYFGVRYSEPGFIFDTGGSSVFVGPWLIYYVTAFLCSKLAYEFLRIQNPTLNFQPGNIAKLPIIMPKDKSIEAEITKLAKENISISKREWNWYETSWNFKTHPILAFKDRSGTIEAAFEKWKEYMQQQFSVMKENEEQLNRYFIDIYEVGSEFTADVRAKHITIRLANREREMKSFLSFAVGCMVGRYSLDEEGLVFAGGVFKPRRYHSFVPEKDNILILSSYGQERVENDIVVRLIEFLKVTFGEETLTTNLEYIADTLGRKKGEQAEAVIRSYFLHDFYKDHLQTYKKRPIYWLFTSGKQGAFSCLVYMHRYDQGLLDCIRRKFVLEALKQLEMKRMSLQSLLRFKDGRNGDYEVEAEVGVTVDSEEEFKHYSKTRRNRNQAMKKELHRVEKQIAELRNYESSFQKLVEQEITINFDDGVAVNYQKFAGLVAPIGKTMVK